MHHPDPPAHLSAHVSAHVSATAGPRVTTVVDHTGATRSSPSNRATGTAAVAEVRDLHIGFERNGRHVSAVRGVDLTIGRGEIVGLVGESGSGKSVLSLALLGLLPEASRPTVTGSARVLGTDMVTAPADVRRRTRRDHLGAVFQDPMTSLNPTMRIGRQVAEAAGSGAEALRLLQAVGIPEAERRLRSYPHELSGGLRQRVMIAMAVAGDPALVVADEPTTALDVTVQAQVLALLGRLRDEVGCSVLLITHDLGVAAQVADRVAVMYAGRLAEVGATGTVLGEPSHPYTVGLMRSRLSLTTDRSRPVVSLPGSAPDPGDLPRGCAFAPRCPLATDDCRETLPEVRISADGHGRACLAPVESVRTLTVEDLSRPDDLAPSGPATDSEQEAAPDSQPEPAGARLATVTRAPDGLAARVSGVQKTFLVKAGPGRRARLAALRRISLDIRDGESVAVVGESGSGKSTLLRVLAGLEKHDNGEIALGLGGRPQMVFQDAGASLTPWLTVADLLEERLRTEGLGRDDRRTRMLAALDAVGLPETVAGARAAELSGGQRQRVALARATVVPPALLLCDEPTSALDVSLAATVLNLVQKLRHDLGMAVVFVTHDLSVARVVADRIAVMYLGQIVEIGEAEAVVASPKHPYTKALLASVPDVGVRPTPLQGEPASPLSPPDGCAFHPRCTLAIATCSDARLDVRLERMRPPLDLPADGDRRLVACIRPQEL